MITFPEYKINNQTILQEQIDEHYDPTQDEIRDYAIYIGIDPDKEPQLLWLAREGFIKPLPPGWKPCQEENGELYYFNFDTGKSSWDHPCDEIYKARVIEERRKATTTNLLDTNSRGTLTQTSTSTVSDYLSGGKKPPTTINNFNNTTATTRQDTKEQKYDSYEYVHSDLDENNDELEESGDEDEQSSDGFQRKIDFGIDPSLSARIEQEEKEAVTTSAIAASRAMETKEKNMSNKKQFDNESEDDDDNDNDQEIRRINNDDRDNQRMQQANRAAEAAIRRLSNTNIQKSGTLTSDDTLNTPREEADLTKFRERLEQSTNEERLQMLEDNNNYLEKLRKELRLEKEKEEKSLRDKLKNDLDSIKNDVRESLAREKRLLESQKQDDINQIKQTIEKEKEDLKKKLQTSMQTDLNVYKASLERQASANAQLQSLEEKHVKEENELKEKLQQIENRHRNELDELQRRYDQMSNEREKLAKQLRDKDNHYSTLQRTIDQLTHEKASIERKLQDTESQLKSIDTSNRPVATPRTQKVVRSTVSDDDDDDTISEEEKFERSRHGLHRNNDEIDRLSDSDSDVVEMERTLKELRQTQLEYMSLLPLSNITDKQNQSLKTTMGTVDLTKLSVADVAPVIRNIRSINRNTPRMYESLDTIPNQLLTDTGRWSNNLSLTLGSTNSLLMYQTLNGYKPTTMVKTNQWNSQPSLVTREAVLKAARTVFAPGVIDQLNSNRKFPSY